MFRSSVSKHLSSILARIRLVTNTLPTVCCSKFGFCGTTKEFCGDKKVKRPSCSVNGQGFQRVVGYYEGWATTNRPCNKFYPEQIPRGVYTHLNYAFATVNPTTFEVELSSAQDDTMLKRLVNLKKADPNLQVFIALGGWTFNDPGPTRTTFSDIARSIPATTKFALSLARFITTYGLDGVDIDWEYPEADDRGGREEDYKNFPLFMSRVKSMLRMWGRGTGLSITLPASFWYLRHFDLQGLQKSVDFFNIMTYDFHGTWDMENRWVGPYLNSHSNLTEIKEAMDLLWRNDVKPENVVLGLAFYGRGFTVSDSGCTKPGCLYASGSPKQQCSGEVSVVLNSEIDDIRNRTGATPVLDKEAAVKILTWDSNKWTTYDDEDTFKIRADFARSQCLGGVMVWAVSHDTKDAKYSKALAKAAGKKFQALEMNSDGTVEVKTDHLQCKWTGCLEDCPDGWFLMRRGDDGARKNEDMIDTQGCPTGGHKLCCPPKQGFLPNCGWYTHHNGKCDQTCPTGMIEVGSNSAYCHNGKYQAACCATETVSMRLHTMCGWSKAFSNCDSGNCSDVYVSDAPGTGATYLEYAQSATGSGGAYCNYSPYSAYMTEKRKYCCREDKADARWENCEWYSNYGLYGKDWPENTCYGNCPSDKVRVAKDMNDVFSCHHGSKVHCCTPKAQTITKRDSDENQEFEKYLRAFFYNDKNCSTVTSSKEYQEQQALEYFISGIIYGTPDSRRIEIWDDMVGVPFPNLKVASLQKWAKEDTDALQEGSETLPTNIMCSMASYNELIGNSTTWLNDCRCDPDWCGTPVVGAPAERRRHAHGLTDDEILARELEKRAGDEFVEIELQDRNTLVTGALTIAKIAYNSIGTWYDNDPIWDASIGVASTVCTVGGMAVVPSLALARTGVDTEHVIDRQIAEHLIWGMCTAHLPSFANGVITWVKEPSLFTYLPLNYFTGTGMQSITSIVPGLPQWPVQIPEQASWRRFMHCFGSDAIVDVFAAVPHNFNDVKGKFFGYLYPWDLDSTMQNLIDAGSYVEFFTNIDMAINVINYLNLPKIQTMLGKIVARQRWVLAMMDYAHTSVHGVVANGVANYDVFMKRHFAVVQSMILWWCGEALSRAARNSNWFSQALVMQGITRVYTTLNAASINMGFYDTRTYSPVIQPAGLPPV